jgi:hypothetical protein
LQQICKDDANGMLHPAFAATAATRPLKRKKAARFLLPPEGVAVLLKTKIFLLLFAIATGRYVFFQHPFSALLTARPYHCLSKNIYCCA